MSYRCSVCNNVVPPGNPRVVHLLKRPNGQILRELQLCGGCKLNLQTGKTAEELLETYRRKEVVQVTQATFAALTSPRAHEGGRSILKHGGKP